MDHIATIDRNVQVDPATLQRLWPVVDVYGRIERALRAQGGNAGDLARVVAADGSAA